MCPSQRTGALTLDAFSLANFTVRLVCLFSLQILISLWVTLSNSDQTEALFDTDQDTKDGKETVLAAVVVAGFLMFLIGILVVGFFFGCGIGPQSTE